FWQHRIPCRNNTINVQPVFNINPFVMKHPRCYIVDNQQTFLLYFCLLKYTIVIHLLAVRSQRPLILNELTDINHIRHYPSFLHAFQSYMETYSIIPSHGHFFLFMMNEELARCINPQPGGR
ncbi:hypothetical protein L9F63_013255, partial [Diploptera punctata]